MFADKKRFLALIGVCLITFTAFIDFTVTNVALPNIQQSLHMPVTELQWVINIYFIVISLLMITTGKLGDLFGARQLFLLGGWLFTLASLICGIAPDPLILLFGRLLQGTAAAIIFPLGAALVALMFTEEQERNQAMSFFGSFNGLGIAIGPTFSLNEMGVITGTVYTTFNIASSVALALAVTIFESIEQHTAKNALLSHNIA